MKHNGRKYYNLYHTNKKTSSYHIFNLHDLCRFINTEVSQKSNTTASVVLVYIAMQHKLFRPLYYHYFVLLTYVSIKPRKSRLTLHQAVGQPARSYRHTPNTV